MNHPTDLRPRMSVRGALEALAAVRDDRTVVVTNQGSARVWPLIADHPLDFHYNPSTMGGAIPLGLGLALANRSFQVVVISGDGSLTMNLGSLITVVAAGASNVTIVVVDNGIYEVTGGQTTASDIARVNYGALARSVGLRSVFDFDDEAIWRRQATDSLSAPGPRLVTLRVDRAVASDLATPSTPISDQLARLSQAIAGR